MTSRGGHTYTCGNNIQLLTHTTSSSLQNGARGSILCGKFRDMSKITIGTPISALRLKIRFYWIVPWNIRNKQDMVRIVHNIHYTRISALRRKNTGVFRPTHLYMRTQDVTPTLAKILRSTELSLGLTGAKRKWRKCCT